MTFNGASPDAVARLATEVAEAENADVLFFSGAIESPWDQEFTQLVRAKHSRPNVILMLTTYGGSADSAYRMCRSLHNHYPEGTISLFISTVCKSAGTLIAVGMDELIMSDEAELGPLDVQLMKTDEVFEWTSGLTPVQALTSLRTETFKTFEHYFLDLRLRSGMQISTKMATTIATRMSIGLFRCIYAQLDPMRLGEYQRAMLIGHYYGARLVRANLTESALEQLIAGYPSHDFVIDRIEAADLFNKVREPNEKELLLANLVHAEAERTLKKRSTATTKYLSETLSPGVNDEQKLGDIDEEIGGSATPAGRVSNQTAGDCDSESLRSGRNGLDEAAAANRDGEPVAATPKAR